MAHQSLYPLDWHEATIRPAPFMELLLAPRFGLAHSELRFFAAPERAMRFIAVEASGRVAELVFAEPAATSTPA